MVPLLIPINPFVTFLIMGNKSYGMTDTAIGVCIIKNKIRFTGQFHEITLSKNVLKNYCDSYEMALSELIVSNPSLHIEML